jgi:hypothetical protein
MSTPPPHKYFGPNYDHPNRRFHFWAVILPTVLVTALAVVVVRETAGSGVSSSAVIPCSQQVCPPASTPTTASRSAEKTSNVTTSAGTASPTVTTTPATSSSAPVQSANPAPSSNLSPTKNSPGPSSGSSPSPQASPGLNVVRATPSQSPAQAALAAVLSSA